MDDRSNGGGVEGRREGPNGEKPADVAHRHLRIETRTGERVSEAFSSAFTFFEYMPERMQRVAGCLSSMTSISG